MPKSVAFPISIPKTAAGSGIFNPTSLPSLEKVEEICSMGGKEVESAFAVVDFFQFTGLSTRSRGGVDQKYMVISYEDVQEFQSSEGDGCAFDAGKFPFEIFCEEQSDPVVGKDRIAQSQNKDTVLFSGQSIPLFQ